ncbi:molybdopterin-dependent oxidoreductase [Nocardiopsis sp. RSe5-2]|uniref:Molybdopterin-dependent oxidoreductase n=1 Tax=Nocardiopsis endophytica TaxID=3018445 RepID=A0ABT4U799_9ACTN|nr:molybdopterin-dependent oxidoreductase [Nocardiopsis endophytica]MDA2812818.1 molybdopterin-dependent oxidoreductase [Nocardiopsis endophytica]
MKRTPRWAAAVCGLVAGGAGLAAAEAAAVPFGPAASPVQAVGAATIDLAPRPLKEFAVATFGTADKLVLLVGIGVVLAVFAAALGIAARGRRWVAGAGAGVLALVGAVAAFTRPDAGPLDILPALVGGTVAYVALVMLMNAAGAGARAADAPGVPEGPAAEDRDPEESTSEGAGATTEEPAEGRGFDRRRFVLIAGAAAAAAAAVGTGAGLYSRTSAGSAAESRNFALPKPASPAPPVPDGADLEIEGLESFFTPPGEFYRIDTALSVPRIDAASWRLRVHGAGVEEREYTFAQLLERDDIIERDVTLACVSNQVGGGYIGNARWIGVPLAEILREAGVRPPSEGGPADQLVSRSDDGMTIGTPVETVMDGRDAMLALGMNGRPLSPEHGFPVRMVVPGLYGYVSACKWITEIELTTFDAFDAYWVPRGWSAEGPIKLQSRIDTPRDGASVGGDGAGVTVAGVAWAQHVGVDGVQVRIDGGEWRDARLAEEATEDTWRQWVFDWEDAEPGEHTVSVRAVGRDGEVQTADEAPPAPDGATGHHMITVSVG